MELEDLREKWSEFDRKLDVSIRLNRRLLTAASLDRVRPPLRMFALCAGLGAMIGLIVTGVLGRFIYAHWTEPRFSLAAVVLDVWVIAITAGSVRQAILALRIDYDGTVASIQKNLELLRLSRIRQTQWALLTGQLVWWVPLLIVALKGLANLDAWKILGAPFLLVNLAVGVAAIPAAMWASKRLAGRFGDSPALRWLIRELAGYNLNAAIGRLAALDEFVNQDS